MNEWQGLQRSTEQASRVTIIAITGIPDKAAYPLVDNVNRSPQHGERTADRADS